MSSTSPILQRATQRQRRLAKSKDQAQPRIGQSLKRFLRAQPDLQIDESARTVALSFSSEAPVDRWYGSEILSHAPGAADLTRLNSGAPLLFNHDLDDVLGVVVSAEIAADGKGRAVVRLGKDERGQWALEQIADGILGNVSFAYCVNDFEEDPSSDAYIATSWSALEISIVTVPADASVGIGRSISYKENTMDRDPQIAGDASPTLSRRQRASAHQSAEVERERVLSIQAACRRYGMQSLESDFINSGASIEEVRSEVLGRMPVQRPVASMAPMEAAGGYGPGGGGVGLSEREVEGFSIVRAINAQLTGDWSRAGFERECSRAAASSMGRQTQGFFVPTEVMQRGQWQARAPYLAGTPAQGGNLVQTTLQGDQFIEALRNTSQVANAGATILSGLVGNVDIPRRTSATNTFWVAESNAITEAESTFDKVSLRPKTVGALSKMSRLMLLQSTPGIEMMTRADLMMQIGLAIDQAALWGTGTSNQPVGIASTSGIGSYIMGTNGANITLDALVALESQLANSNAPLSSRAYLLNTKTISTLKNLKSSTGTYLWTDSAPGQRSGTPLQFNGYPVLSTNQLRSTLTKGTATSVCSELIFGAWTELVIAQWGALEIVLNPYDSVGFTTGDVLIRAMQTVDIGVKHPASFAIISDALTP